MKKLLLVALLVASSIFTTIHSMWTISKNRADVNAAVLTAVPVTEVMLAANELTLSKDKEIQKRAAIQATALGVALILTLAKDDTYKEIYATALDEIERLKEGKEPDTKALEQQQAIVSKITKSEHYAKLQREAAEIGENLSDIIFPITIEPKVGAGI